MVNRVPRPLNGAEFALSVSPGEEAKINLLDYIEDPDGHGFVIQEDFFFHKNDIDYLKSQVDRA